MNYLGYGNEKLNMLFYCSTPGHISILVIELRRQGNLFVGENTIFYQRPQAHSYVSLKRVEKISLKISNAAEAVTKYSFE